MNRKRFTPEQIITMLREAEVLLNRGYPVQTFVSDQDLS